MFYCHLFSSQAIAIQVRMIQLTLIHAKKYYRQNKIKIKHNNLTWFDIMRLTPKQTK